MSAKNYKFTSGLLAKTLATASADKKLKIEYESKDKDGNDIIMNEFEGTLMKLYMMTVGHPTNTERAPPRKKSAGTYVGCTRRTIFSRLVMHNKPNGFVINKKTKKSASRWFLAMIIFVPPNFDTEYYNINVKRATPDNNNSNSDDENSSSSESADSPNNNKYETVRMCLTKIIRNYWKRAHGINGKFRRGLEIVNMFDGLKFYATKDSLLYIDSMK